MHTFRLRNFIFSIARLIVMRASIRQPCSSCNSHAVYAFIDLQVLFSLYIIIMQSIFTGPLGSLGSFSQFENRVLLKPALEGVAIVAPIIAGHEQTQLNRVCYFHYFGIFFASKESSYTELILAAFIRHF